MPTPRDELYGGATRLARLSTGNAVAAPVLD
jgi:hypothetical protein